MTELTAVPGLGEFMPWPKIPRLSRDMIITEKLDGTNGLIQIESYIGQEATFVHGEFAIYVGSRSRWISPKNDNHGFALWVGNNLPQVVELGLGRHFGEWWGKGIQRGYDLSDRRFSLFNVGRWCPDDKLLGDGQERPPTCCNVVPILHRGPFDTHVVRYATDQLAMGGSVAAPGFMKPEGVIVYHSAGNHLYKKLIEGDELPKSLAA